MAPLTIEEIGALAAQVSAKYKRMPFVDPRDLRQTAWEAVLDADRRYDPARNTSRRAYLWSAAQYAVAAQAIRGAHPVSSAHDPADVIGTTSAPLYCPDPDHDEEGWGELGLEEAFAAEAPTPEEALAAARQDAAVMERLAELFDEFAFDLRELHGEDSSAFFAHQQRTGIGPKRTHRMIREALAEAEDDPVLYLYWRNP